MSDRLASSCPLPLRSHRTSWPTTHLEAKRPFSDGYFSLGFLGRNQLGRERVIARLATAAIAMVIGGGAGAVGLSPASASASVTASATTTALARAAGGCATGKYQKAVEGYLNKLGEFGKLKVDGKQSAADCAAIKKFQKRYDIRPAAGTAGPTTNSVAKRLAGTNTKACKAKRTGTTVCVDLSKQTVWVMKNGKVYVKPTVTRTGMQGYRTPAVIADRYHRVTALRSGFGASLEASSTGSDNCLRPSGEEDSQDRPRPICRWLP